MRSDLFDCLPQSAALLLLSSILQLTDAHAVQRLPRKTPEPTITVPYRALNVAPWPLHATPPPGGDTFANRRRQLDDTFNTVCGYINGDQNLPATCGQGSHCVVDTDHNVVGCCPNGAPSCTAGVFTGCVDGNSGPQTEVNPYIYSCTGSDVCYMNVYEGGFSQYGCGTASDLAATVQNSASGITAVLTRPTVSVSYTQGISTLSEPTTLGTPRSRTRSSTVRTSHSSSATSASSTSSESTSSTSEPAAPPATDKSYRTGAIIGGTIGGLAVLIALGALAFFLRRRNANIRQGPGLGGVRGKIISPPQPGKGTGFAALASDDADAFETGPAGSVLNQPYPQQQQQQQQPQMTMHTTAAPTAAAPTAAAAAAAAAGAAASAPPTNRSLLPPIATSPPMPFQSEVSPVDRHDLDTPYAYSNSAVSASAAAASGLSAISVSPYPPSSSGGVSSADSGNSLPTSAMAAAAAAAGAAAYQHHQPYQNPGPTAYAGGSGVLMGMNPLLLNRGAERHLESDQVPLTSGREVDDFSHGYHAALGRIGEEDEEGEEEQRRSRGYGGDQAPYRDHVGESAGDNAATGGTGSGDGVKTVLRGEARPLWQQNRRQSRNLMWM
ncbi:hypothetical protein MYCTH_2310612 [Thermothelomyces thermophilus ATCC 42464]|uniref:Mid2 domain-containing protein n=1 Tax=Thermothelomyces thermophilus (strain ATCC 42464 / BCRC 31852 / DSM 1799) TaxID=573729 RepID=G2QLR6_THET4|nr:uncharacterized protein MYCTH_2310612 [Thermothelomyces thermophilus ATCC 42464]AEO60896.1 hypothetical protein MYCTH_2310612 [Thermothelomyces thermophilus ATCC 42464]